MVLFIAPHATVAMRLSTVTPAIWPVGRHTKSRLGLRSCSQRDSSAIEKHDLIVTDVEVLRLHYAKTLKRGVDDSKETG